MIVSYQKQKKRLSQYLPSGNRTARTARTSRQSTLKISYSSLQTLDTVYNFQHLTFISINYCHIRSLSGIEQFTLLQQLQAKYNLIEVISHLTHNRALKILNLIGNKCCKNGTKFANAIQSMRLPLIQINSMRVSDFKRIYPQIPHTQSIQTQQSQQIKNHKIPHRQKYFHIDQQQSEQLNHRGYQSIDDIDQKLQSCADTFHKYSLLSKAFVAMKSDPNNSIKQTTFKNVQNIINTSSQMYATKPMKKPNILLNIDMINAEYDGNQ